MAKKNFSNGIVYSTNPDFKREENTDSFETILPSLQKLYVSIDRKSRAGKSVTLVEGFIGNSQDLDKLAKELKTKCGVGGTTKDGVILIQGEFKDKIAEYLKSKGFQIKLKGG